ncbi:HlyD family efflux transporter periplasmic adaptor subunit [Geminicoccaceae bacterium 1502E]|nr:HlyD family efflux transporter periplasmic adaptor subunit [Geminicoccaceae bacterium 1502E]
MAARGFRSVLLVLVVGGLAAGGWYAWRSFAGPALLEGFAVSNGRIEAERVDVATRYAGRVADVLVEEGDWVDRGQLVARMDTLELEAQLREAEAATAGAREQLARATAEIAQRQSELAYAVQEHERARMLFQKGHLAKEVLDQRTSTRRAAEAGLDAAKAGAASATASIEAAVARGERIRVMIEDSALKAPRAGRVEYRLAQPGEVLPGGGKVLSLLDLTDVYMTLFLPTREAGRLAIGAEARIVLDAAPDYVIPAKVSFVASDAQFTPRHVETAQERSKLVFRVKVQIARPLLERYAPLVKTGLPGIAHVRIVPEAVWPDSLQPRLPQTGAAADAG